MSRKDPIIPTPSTFTIPHSQHTSSSSSTNQTNYGEIPTRPLTTLSSVPTRTTPPYAESSSIASTTKSNTSLPKSHSSQTDTTGYRPLNVKDALSYLDQVKIQFGDRPDVYNRFLDIMKDFKSQSIDTPGVIERVSTLFQGHLTLISGFNTFLPPGYRIECSTDPRDPDLIRVTTPSGTITTSTKLHPQHYPPPPMDKATIPANPMYYGLPYANFNNAINYVNKIKNRFIDNPDAYKQFLEVLQTYQKEEQKIEDVYAHVQRLFHGHGDLLDEFQQFLPEQKKMKPGNETSINHDDDERYIKRVGYSNSQGFDPNNPSISAGEVELFEQIRKHIGNKPSYEVFLKLLNLYTQDIVDLDTLLERVDSFLGNKPELFDWFKSVIGYETTVVSSFSIFGSEKPHHIIPKPDLVRCKTVRDSPSYRLWQHQPCSGRDSLCWEVLNDAYVSHPIWASEDSAFVASKKNPYEEAMHRCEEDRYEYDLNIDANLNCIALLEPIVKKIEIMSQEEQEEFTLTPGLGGQTVSIYERILKKIYGSDRGSEIIQMLYSDPARVAPVVMKRLKQKDKEWTKGQLEWNKVWREIDEKNYYKSLDYQGLTFKTTERKTITNRYLLNEIESIYQHQDDEDDDTDKHPMDNVYQFTCDDIYKDISLLIFSYMEHQTGFSKGDRDKVRHFLQLFVPRFFDMDDEDEDMEEANDQDGDEGDDTNPSSPPSEDYSDADHHQGKTNNKKQRRQVQQRSSQRQQAFRSSSRIKTATANNNRSKLKSDGLSNDEEDSSNQSENRTDRTNENNDEQPLILEKQTISTATSPTTSSTSSISETALSSLPSLDEYDQSKQQFLFGNSHFYCFIRLYEILFGRLAKMKRLGEKLGNESKADDFNSVAEKLGLKSNRFDNIDLTQGHYKALLEQIDRFFDSDVDIAMFEEIARYLFTTEAYILFNIDKLVHALVKQIQTIIGDEKSMELLRLYQDNHQLNKAAIYRPLSVYRDLAENIIGQNEHVFQLDYNKDKQRLSIHLVGQDGEETNQYDQHEKYLTSYMKWPKVTQGLTTSLMIKSSLKRNLIGGMKSLDDVIVESKLEYLVDDDTYRLSYKPDTEDLFYRPSSCAVSWTKYRWENLLLSKGFSHEDTEKEARQLLIGKHGLSLD
ncbi:uncharacterized protein BX664DRAFT_267268 [Halteromyces radiatus]|uniref:uncharacterized protein n=1 Tax=Halteromyces radiatus TaxID=101107 RepID=UPI00221FA5BC|nr:uncharacterized protein BX664DRAFT_267268 [Halteromyces radiatus]KAI8084776.1 hypothetical protein BX664DRAFT_267268 [Halteromyces radiatus]